MSVNIPEAVALTMIFYGSIVPQDDVHITVRSFNNSPLCDQQSNVSSYTGVLTGPEIIDQTPYKNASEHRLPNCHPHSFYNPYRDKLSNAEITSSSKNRCTLYPRCLLFGCCSPSLLGYVEEYFAESSCGQHHQLNSFKCMRDHKSCSHDTPISERLSKLPIINDTLNHTYLFNKLAELPPTHPKVYHMLERRCVFKVLYLVQGDYRDKLPAYMRSLGDLLYLSYKEKQLGMTSA